MKLLNKRIVLAAIGALVLLGSHPLFAEQAVCDKEQKDVQTALTNWVQAIANADSENKIKDLDKNYTVAQAVLYACLVGQTAGEPAPKK